MTKFKSLGLSSKVLEAVRLMGYDEPTPVQEKTIPLVLEGKDVIAGAQTGTGKTAAFCLPCLDKLPHAEKHCGPYMLVVTPTRELADQIGEVCNQITQVTRHKVTTVVGGVSYNPQKEALRRGTDVLIATPGRLEDLMHQEAVGLDQVQVLVLDEADRMVDMGFLPAVKRIVDACTAPHQTLLFSATIDETVKKVSKTMLKDPAWVRIAKKGQTADTVDQFVVNISHAAKPSALKAVLAERGAERVIVFARTRHRADSCTRRINKMGFKAEAIHSDRSQAQRRHSLEAFASGKVKVLVATDVLARGIDIDQVDYVINYDLPTQPEDYIHRIGRTGRAGARGYAVSFVAPENREDLLAIEALIKQTIPAMDLKNFDKEGAESEAETRSLQLQARRAKDPEVEKVIEQLGAEKRKERKKRAKQAKQDAIREEKGLMPDTARSKRKPPQKASASSKPKPRKPKSANKTKSAERPKQQFSKPINAPSQKRDNRPGRAHRAAVAAQRSRKSS